jgi:trehalose synthase
MLETVDVGSRTLRSYRGVAPDHVLDELVQEAERMRGARVLHVNATPMEGASPSCSGPSSRSSTTWAS